MPKGKQANNESLSMPISPLSFVSPDFLRHAEYFQKFISVAWELPTSRSKLEEILCPQRILT